MKTKILFMMVLVVALLANPFFGMVQAEASVARYYIGKVTGLDAVKNILSITEYNSNSPITFKFDQKDMLYDVSLGEEVVVVADKNNNAKEVRLVSEREQNPIGRIPGQNVRSGVFRRPQNVDPFEEIAILQEQMNRMFQNSFQTAGAGQGLFNSSTSFDKDFQLEDKGDSYIVQFDMEGLDKDSVDIEVNKNAITLKGQSDRQEQQTDNNGAYSYRSFGTFIKTIPMPPDADTEKLETKQEGDIIVLKIPKKV